MYMSRFGVKRYKCLGEIDIPLTPIHVLIGENDAGKTSLLEAMAAFLGSADGRLQGLFPEPWTGRELVSHGSEDPSVELSGEWRSSAQHDDPSKDSSVAFTFGIRFRPDGRQCVASAASLRTDGGPELRGLERHLPGDYAPQRYWREHGTAPQPVSREQFERVVRLFKPAHLFRFDPKYMALPAAIDTKRKFKLDRDGFGLPTLLMDIVGYDAARFLGLRDEFCRLFPQFRTIRIESEHGHQRLHAPAGLHTFSGTGIGSAIYLETRGGATVRAGQASDGAILFLGFLALANLPEPPSLILLEEPENGVYPKRLGEIIALLKQLTNHGDTQFPQIIMTTHSPYLLSFFEPEEVTFLSRPPGDPDGPVRARPLRDAPNIRERLGGGEFYLGELWYNLTEEDLFGAP